MRMLKWGGLSVAVVLAAVLALRFLIAPTANAGVLEEIAADPHGERARVVMALTLPDGRTLPVNYLREGRHVYAGADGRWWRTLREGDVAVSVQIRGETLAGRARVALDEPEFKAEVFSRLRPDVPSWLPEWLDAHLVVIELD